MPCDSPLREKEMGLRKEINFQSTRDLHSSLIYRTLGVQITTLELPPQMTSSRFFLDFSLDSDCAVGYASLIRAPH